MITDNNNLRPTQFRELKKAIPTYCAEQDYVGVDEIIRTEVDWDESTYYTPEPDYMLWSREYETKVADAKDGSAIMGLKIVTVNENLRDRENSKYERIRKYEEKKWNKCQDDKK